jgi:hypothetical protein
MLTDPAEFPRSRVFGNLGLSFPKEAVLIFDHFAMRMRPTTLPPSFISTLPCGKLALGFNHVSRISPAPRVRNPTRYSPALTKWMVNCPEASSSKLPGSSWRAPAFRRKTAPRKAYTVITDSHGIYSIPKLPAAEYHIDFDLPPTLVTYEVAMGHPKLIKIPEGGGAACHVDARPYHQAQSPDGKVYIGTQTGVAVFGLLAH